MTPKEQTRLQVLNSLLVEHMTLDQAATLIGVSPRHTRRILADYRKNGAASLAHGHRGRKPANAIPKTTRSRVVHLARTVYEGANHTHLSELLSEREGLDMGRTTLRRILVNAGLSSPRRRRPPKHRMRRQRMPREGMLIQMDGSYHRWLGGQAPPFTLLIAVDDATGAVVDALFCEQEDAHSYFLLIQGLVQHVGIPVALYTDRHGVFRHTPGPGLPGMPTQFSRAMDELGSPGPTRCGPPTSPTCPWPGDSSTWWSSWNGTAGTWCPGACPTLLRQASASRPCPRRWIGGGRRCSIPTKGASSPARNSPRSYRTTK